ncbi:Thioredoxin superfamily protein [Perilla frutescens var. hirtella]|uniref:Thioredoxin superfamily protein n=1 Tax=Perilla frutescens var. hirtella TaxID=608512 RepID=A0AAD4J5V6_PERFH|nr:Thioredoxin superfamily protein [Perilla frutescens var. hirtella]KAH6827662.1 Thioredoxin superfamily protein [Perilla frutescens var. hirtella]
MAKIISPSTSLLFSSPLYQNSLFPSQSLSISTKPIIRPCFSRNPNGPSLVVRASSSSTTTAAAVVPDDISNVLGEVTIFTAAGDPVKFKELWDQQEGIAVVALLRHFGCFCCWELAATLKEAKEKFDSAGVKLIAVGVGTPDKAQLLAERLPFPLDSLYADPDRKAYDVLGLYYGFRRTFLNPASTKVFSRFEELKKAMKNYTIKATPDDTSSVLQQGGMFVFKGKQLLYARKDEGTGDHAPLNDIFDICCNVPAP